MNEAKATLVANIPAMLFAICALIALFFGMNGWGWFLLLSVFTLHTCGKSKDSE